MKSLEDSNRSPRIHRDRDPAGREHDALLSQPVLSCEEARLYLHLYVESALDPIRNAHVHAHVACCGDCRDHLEGLEEERLWVAEVALDAPRLPGRFAKKVTAQIRADQSKKRTARRFVAFAALSSACAALLIVAFTLQWNGLFSPDSDSSSLVTRNPAEKSPLSVVASRSEAVPPKVRETRIEPVIVKTPVPRDNFDSDGFDIDCLAVDTLDNVGGEDPSGPRGVGVSIPVNLIAEAALEVEDEMATVESLLAMGAVHSFVTSPLKAYSALSRRDSPVTCQCTLENFLAFTVWVDTYSTRNPRRTKAPSETVPCSPDPNADGKTDGSDIAFCLQQLLRTASIPANLSNQGIPQHGGYEKPSLGV